MHKYRFTDEEIARLELDVEVRKDKRGLDACPVCSWKNDGSKSMYESGIYRYNGELRECPTDDYGHVMLNLFKLYRLGNIPRQYMVLDWAEFPQGAAKTEFDSYIEDFDLFSKNGQGFTIHGVGLGSGKTWAATHVLKERLKRGTKGWWQDFRELRWISEHDLFSSAHRRIMEAELLVLDEVVAPFSQASHQIHADKLEDILRFRTNHNFPTIVTTNMTPAVFAETYPRCASLLGAKQYPQIFNFDDVRQAGGKVFLRNEALTQNREVAPIT